MAKGKSESFWFTSRSDIRTLAGAFREGIDRGQGFTQKLKGGVSFARPTNSGDDPYDDLFGGTEPEFHVVAMIPTGRADAAVPVAVHLKLWNTPDGALRGEVEGRYGGVLLSSEGRSRCRSYMAKGIEGLKAADGTLREARGE